MDPVLVTGTSGLLGGHLAERLQAEGVDVLGLDRRPPNPAARFPHVVGDAADLPMVRRLLDRRPNVIHSGAVSGPMLMLDDPYGITEANIAGALAVFEACRLGGIRRLVWTSSIAVYGDQPTLDPIPETTTPNPQSFYGHTKAAGEMLLRGYVARYGLPAVALRLSSVFGPHRQTACALRAVIEAGLDGRPAAVAAVGTSYRQYIAVEDATEAVLLALAAPAPGQFAYNVTGGTYFTEAELAMMISPLVPGLAIVQAEPAWNEGHLGPLVIEAAARDLGYRPAVSLHDGLARLVGHLRAGRPT